LATVKRLGADLLEYILTIGKLISALFRCQSLPSDALEQIVRAWPSAVVSNHPVQLIESAAVARAGCKHLNQPSHLVEHTGFGARLRGPATQ